MHIPPDSMQSMPAGHVDPSPIEPARLNAETPSKYVCLPPPSPAQPNPAQSSVMPELFSAPAQCLASIHPNQPTKAPHLPHARMHARTKPKKDIAGRVSARPIEDSMPLLFPPYAHVMLARSTQYMLMLLSTKKRKSNALIQPCHRHTS